MKARFAVAAGAIVITATVACSPVLPMSSSQPAPLSVPATPAQRGDIAQTLSFSGDVRAQNQVTVLPKASGRVQQMLVDIGATVRSGDTIAVLESDSPEIAVLQAQASLSAAQSKLATIQAGAKPDDVVIAQQALAQQQAKLDGHASSGPIPKTSPRRRLPWPRSRPS